MIIIQCERFKGRLNLGGAPGILNDYFLLGPQSGHMYWNWNQEKY